METNTEFLKFVYWFLDYGFDIIGVLVIFWLFVYFIARVVPKICKRSLFNSQDG